MRRLAATLCLLLALPIVGVLGAWFVPRPDSLELLRHQFSTVMPGYALSSLLLAVGVAAGVALLGGATAAAVTLFDFPGRRVFEWALLLPLAMPAYVLAYAATDFLQFSGPLQNALRDLSGATGPLWPDVRSLPGAVALFTLALYPYVYLLTRGALLERGLHLMEAARLLGAGLGRRVREVALPLARPAIAAGVALALMETQADYGVGAYFGLTTFTTGIYKAWLVMDDRIAAAQLATLLLGTVALLLWAERRAQARLPGMLASRLDSAPIPASRTSPTVRKPVPNHPSSFRESPWSRPVPVKPSTMQKMANRKTRVFQSTSRTMSSIGSTFAPATMRRASVAAMIETSGGGILKGRLSPTRNSPTMTRSTPRAKAANHGRSIDGRGSSAGSGRRVRQISPISQGRRGTIARTASRPPRLTCRRYWPKLMPIELPTRNVAGSPTSVRSPAELLTIAVRTMGPTKSTWSDRATPMITDRDKDGFANIMRMNADGSGLEIYARGVRNTVGFDWHPKTGELWFTDNGRDWMGDDTPPCELNRVSKAGQHFGYPYCHGGNIADPEFGKGRSCADYTPPVLRLNSSLAPISSSYTQQQFPLRGAAFLIAPEDRAAFEAFWNHTSVPLSGRGCGQSGNDCYNFTDVTLYEVQDGAHFAWQNFNAGLTGGYRRVRHSNRMALCLCHRGVLLLFAIAVVIFALEMLGRLYRFARGLPNRLVRHG